ncbi:MAG: hypothetical protein KKD64_10385 [Alphaproteobacteria bacterium]|nr:hypothetical protein [Alphaproteobacteria bacterium]MBU0795554.1 hypothetical protein [Alphaproteobacteria bacterium]MBU0874643.1 hypothetical protein [Alphaproteobacteria bacterium]MBU1770051.1 hypothetical protein [Alphaproteobacteria bacterium]
MDYIATAMSMRAEAWAELVQSPAFRAFRAADNMVIELGGESIMPQLGKTPKPVDATHTTDKPITRRKPRAADGSPRMTQVEAASNALKQLGPMGIAMLTEMAKEQGAAIGGNDPVANFRSALSKDKKFYSFRHEGEYLWWLTDVPLPEGWSEAADDLLRNAASPDNTRQEGGDGHAANNTILAS